MDLITIVVPVYNVAEYLEKCVDSLLKQTYTMIEILLIDDGSTDGISPNLCDQLAQTDSRIRVIHKENGGLSDARNAGIREAKGKYVGLIDSDDYVDPDMFELLYHNLMNEGADLSICGVYQVYGNRVDQPSDQGRYVLNREETVKMVLESSKISVNAVNRLYPIELFSHVQFPFGKTSEDAHIILDILAQVEKVVVDLRPKYYYVHRGGSITTSDFKPRDLSVIDAYQRNYDIVCRDYPNLEPVAAFRRYWSHFYVLDKMLLSAQFGAIKERKKIIRFLRKNTFGIVRNPFVGKGRKMASLALFFHVRLYKVFLKQYRRGRERL